MGGRDRFRSFRRLVPFKLFRRGRRDGLGDDFRFDDLDDLGDLLLTVLAAVPGEGKD